MEVKDIDLMDTTLFTSPRALEGFALLRREAPVHWYAAPDGGIGFWVVSRYDDVVWMLRHPEIFSSEYGNILPTRARRDPTAGLMTFTTDPPVHTKLRSPFSACLTPRMVENVRPMVSTIVRGIIDEVATGDPFDFMAEVAERLPLAVSCGLMGVPEQDWGHVLDLAHASHGMKELNLVAPTASRKGSSTANLTLLAYLTELVARRRKQPEDDLVSKVAQSEVGDRRLTDEEIAVNCFALTLGGFQADRNAMGGGVLALMDHPGEFEHLVREPQIMPTAVDEILRWTTPTLNLARVALIDTEIAGVPITQGDRVSAWLYSANRDETVFEEPHRLILTRHPNRHLSFGNGAHYCAGTHVARLEMSVLLDTILDRGLRFEKAGEPTHMASHFQQGLKNLPVRLVKRQTPR
ncbi:cytochrome P450 [Streptomyces sp. NPDC050164]|uniref:cytochrome P450 n=1 Tax=Streptomyces sp. NPDC050164 TaxID=3365605 RepID=UPI00379234B7